jgi:5'-methylthioadenosine phosphorylase
MSQIKIGLIGGSGLGAALSQQTDGPRHNLDTPFGRTSDAIIETQWSGLPIFFLNRHGPGHLLNPTQVPYRANLFALKQLGVTHILATGAVGSLREEYKPRHLVIPDQLIDKTNQRPSTFYDHTAVHVEFAEPFSPVLRQILIDASSGEPASGSSEPSRTAGGNEMKTHPRACYLCMEGPAFSTRAESLMHRLWGADLIGMTALPEAKLAREAEISYALIALVTDYDSWRPQPAPKKDDPQTPPDPAALLKEIISNLDTATTSALALIRRAVQLMSERTTELLNCPAQQALKLAIWSNKAQISPDERKRLLPLWAKYFEA